jgi:uncharacterized iron-regulated membrane protein
LNSQTTPANSESALYRRVWRWHFYAGLICLPFLAMMALTGALYLFKEPIESLVYAPLRFIEKRRCRPWTLNRWSPRQKRLNPERPSDLSRQQSPVEPQKWASERLRVL